jgi:hypothetical protein
MLKEAPAHLENSMELIEDLYSRDRTTNLKFPYPFSLDVIALYTSVPIHEAIKDAIDRIKNTTYIPSPLKTSLSSPSITHILHSTPKYTSKFKASPWVLGF